MTDYGHPITFGLSLYPSVDQLDETRQLAQAADDAGLDYLAIQDHASPKASAWHSASEQLIPQRTLIS